MRAMILRTAGFVILFALCLPADNEARNTGGHWQIEAAGGVTFIADNDLGLFTTAENRYLDLYFRTAPGIGTITDPGLKTLRLMLTGRVAFQYRMGKRFRLAVGLDYLDGSVSNTGTFTFRNDQGWRILTDSLAYQALGTRLRLIFPNLGLCYRFPLKAKMALETGINVGPVFATAKLKRHIQDRIEVRELDPPLTYLMYQDERAQSMTGSGIGLGAQFKARLLLQVHRRLGVFLETGCGFYSVNSLEGAGTLTAGGRTREWQAEWFMVRENVEKSWGTAEFVYPANDPNLLNRSAGDFHLRIFCFPSLRIGFQLNL